MDGFQRVHPGPGRGKKRPPSLPTTPDDDESTTNIDDTEWLVSDSGSEEGEDHDNQGANDPFTVDKFPTATCDHEEQINVLYIDPETRLRGPLPIRRYPPFRGGYHFFCADYKVNNESELTVRSARDCFNGCQCRSMHLFQLVDIKIAGYRHDQPGRANIYGFVAMRDTVEPLRNYVYRRDVNNCEAISVNRKTGVARLSLTSPARVISMVNRVLIEFELYVRTDALPEDKPKGECLIEGCTEFTDFHESKSFVQHRRMYGKRCALDVKYIRLINAVLRLGAIAGGVNMKLLAKTSGFDEVIRLFRGAAPEPHSIMTFVVAVERRNNLDLYIEAAPRDDPFVGKEKSMSCSWQVKKPVSCSWWKCSFGSDYHDMDKEVAELGG
ncbi:hypothetical protein PVAP13_3KG497400, partial [Panicum virgatum]